MRLKGPKGKQLECAIKRSAEKRNSISLGLLPSKELMSTLPVTSKGARRKPGKFSIVIVVISDFKNWEIKGMLLRPLLGNSIFGVDCCQSILQFP